MLKTFLETIILLILIIIYGYIKKNAIINKEFLSINHTNILKGIAAIFVVIQHIGNKNGLRYVTPLGGIGVAIFLICSGYGLYKSYLKVGLNNYFRKKIVRIIIPYWEIVILYSVINYSKITIDKFLKCIFLINTIPYMWFIQLILVEYLIFYLIFYLVEKKIIDDKYVTLIWIVIGIIMILGFKNSLIAEQAFSFVLGVILARNIQTPLNKKVIKKAVLFIGIGIGALFLKQTSLVREGYYFVFNIVQLILKLSTAIGIIYLTDYMSKYRLLNIFSNIGKVSFEIYLSHTVLIFILGNNASIERYLVYIVCNIVIVVLLHKFSKYINKLILA